MVRLPAGHSTAGRSDAERRQAEGAHLVGAADTDNFSALAGDVALPPTRFCRPATTVSFSAGRRPGTGSPGRSGAFNNWIDSGQSFSDTSSQLTGRVTVGCRWSRRTRATCFTFGFGLRHSNVKQTIRGRVTPEFNHAPLYVDTGELIRRTTRSRTAWKHTGARGRTWWASSTLAPTSTRPSFRRPLLPRLSPQRFLGRHRCEMRGYRKAKRDFQSASGGQAGQSRRLGHTRDRLPVLAARPDRRGGGRRRDGHLFAGSQLVAHPVGTGRCELSVHLSRPLSAPKATARG